MSLISKAFTIWSIILYNATYNLLVRFPNCQLPVASGLGNLTITILAMFDLKKLKCYYLFILNEKRLNNEFDFDIEGVATVTPNVM